MRKRSLCCGPVSVCLSVCPSVCLSVMLVHSIQTAEDTIKLLSRPGTPFILLFWPPAPISNSKGNPFSGGAKYKGWENFAIFDWNRLYLRNGTRFGSQGHGCYGTLIGIYMRSIQRWHFQWPWRTPKPVFKVMAFLKLNISKNGAS